MKKNEKIRLRKCVNIANVENKDRILDIGCGKDKPLKNFLGEDIEYTGIDRLFGDDLEGGLPPHIQKNKFDIIFMNEFIEHIEHFKTLLMDCRDILSKRGRIIISTPSNNRILYGDFFNGTGEEPTHIHCFRKTNMRTLAKICNLKIAKISGTYIRFPPILHRWIVIPTNQTLYTETIIYRLEK